MRIVSWNIRAGGGRRVGEIAAQLERWSPDVVALQEFRGTPPSRALAEALAQRGLEHQRSSADGKRPAANGLLVASRWPLRKTTHRGGPEEPRRWLLLAVAAPRPFAIGALHAPNFVSGRKYSFLNAVLAVARHWRGGPALLIGDTNSGRIGLDEETPVFSEREDGWLRALEDANWRDAFRQRHGEARAYTWYSPNAGNGFRLDEAFLNRYLSPHLTGARYEWGVATEDTRREALSDHAALIIDLDS